MKITVISDLHGAFPELPGGDLLILAGDYTATNKVNEWKRFYAWLEAQNYRQKVYIGGNHDNFLAQSISSHEQRQMFEVPDTNIEYLFDSGFTFEGLKIWGSPWTVTFPGINPHCKAFTLDPLETDALDAKWAFIPPDTNILITHSPPFSILDINSEGQNCGSLSLGERLLKLDQMKLHVFGHIHECYGKVQHKNFLSLNASHMDVNYNPVNKPFTFVL